MRLWAIQLSPESKIDYSQAIVRASTWENAESIALAEFPDHWIVTKMALSEDGQEDMILHSKNPTLCFTY